MNLLGIAFAVGALLSWTFGDFSIQRTVRAVGDVKTLLSIGVVGTVLIFPFIAGELPALVRQPQLLLLLCLTGVVIFFAALFDFEALKRGKLAIIEPLLGIELPITIALSIVLWGERLSLPQILLTFTTFLGIVLAVTIHHTHLHYHRRLRIERGVIFAGVGSIVMGLVNFLVGVSSQTTSPLMAIWFTNAVFSLICLAYIAARGELAGIAGNLRRHPISVAATSVLDNGAWIFFAFAASLIPIAVATTVSEAYIALAALLGVFLNREKLRYHQYVGVAVAIASVILLSAVT